MSEPEDRERADFGQQIELVQATRAERGALWRACATSAGLANWQADEADGLIEPGQTLTLHWSAFETTMRLRVVTVEPESRLVLRGRPGEVELVLDNDQVKLTHRNLGPTEDPVGLRGSWQLALAQLAHYAERHPGRQRRVHWLVRKVLSSPEQVYLHLSEPALLQRWLARSGQLGPTGSSFSLQLDADLALVGKVLANVTGRDIALSVENLGEAVLSIRTLPALGAPAERMLAFVWSEWGPQTDASERLLTALDEAQTRFAALLAKTALA